MKINNPYLRYEGYNCFGCAPENPLGLKMHFELVEGKVVSEWMPSSDHQGFHQIVHGGILAALLDEIAGWAIQVLCKTSGFTSEMRLRYLKPAYVHQGPLRLEAKLIAQREKHADIEVNLWDKEGVLCTSATVTYYLFSDEVAREKFHYPGVQSFLQG